METEIHGTVRIKKSKAAKMFWKDPEYFVFIIVWILPVVRLLRWKTLAQWMSVETQSNKLGQFWCSRQPPGI